MLDAMQQKYFSTIFTVNILSNHGVSVLLGLMYPATLGYPLPRIGFYRDHLKRLYGECLSITTIRDYLYENYGGYLSESI